MKVTLNLHKFLKRQVLLYRNLLEGSIAKESSWRTLVIRYRHSQLVIRSWHQVWIWVILTSLSCCHSQSALICLLVHLLLSVNLTLVYAVLCRLEVRLKWSDCQTRKTVRILGATLIQSLPVKMGKTLGQRRLSEFRSSRRTGATRLTVATLRATSVTSLGFHLQRA